MSDSGPLAGWYPDPSRPGTQRYHDGSHWTDEVAPGPGAAVAPAPGPAPKKGSGGKILLGLLACSALAILALVVGLAAGGGDDDEAASTTSPPADSTGGSQADPAPGDTAAEEVFPPAGSQEILPQGATGTSSDLEITVNAVEDPWTPTNELDTPPAGQRYVGVEMTVVNTTDASTVFSTLLNVEVTDSENRPSNIAITASTDPAIDGEIPAGGTRRGWAYVAVDEGATGLIMRVKGSITAEDALFALS